MGFTAKQCVVIEDSPSGVLAGINAGIPTYYYNTLAQPSEFSQVIEFNSMHLLPSLLNKSATLLVKENTKH